MPSSGRLTAALQLALIAASFLGSLFVVLAIVDLDLEKLDGFISGDEVLKVTAGALAMVCFVAALAVYGVLQVRKDFLGEKRAAADVEIAAPTVPDKFVPPVLLPGLPPHWGCPVENLHGWEQHPIKTPAPIPAPLNNFSCPECFIPFSYAPDLKRHLQLFHSISVVPKDEFPHACLEMSCARTFASKIDAQVHMEDFHGWDKVGFSCWQCGMWFENQLALDGHVNTIHAPRHIPGWGNAMPPPSGPTWHTWHLPTSNPASSATMGAYPASAPYIPSANPLGPLPPFNFGILPPNNPGAAHIPPPAGIAYGPGWGTPWSAPAPYFSRASTPNPYTPQIGNGASVVPPWMTGCSAPPHPAPTTPLVDCSVPIPPFFGDFTCPFPQCSKFVKYATQVDLNDHMFFAHPSQIPPAQFPGYPQPPGALPMLPPPCGPIPPPPAFPQTLPNAFRFDDEEYFDYDAEVRESEERERERDAAWRQFDFAPAPATGKEKKRKKRSRVRSDPLSDSDFERDFGQWFDGGEKVEDKKSSK